jgi:3-methyladenine DNA glycosylase AlkC
MADAFKNLIHAGTVADIATHLRRVQPRFEAAAFSALACEGLEALEFKGRARHIAAALAQTLPADFGRAADALEAALGPPGEGDEGQIPPTSERGLGGWAVWPLAEFVADRGLDHPQRALQALHALTQRFTAEWAIRPFIERHPQLVFETLGRWTRDPSAHVRRLVSEGSRPRLPWGLQLRSLIADPTPTLVLLEALQDDPSAYVRRSVANHLNDIAKDHPALVARWLATHLPQASPQRRALLRHASRTLIKRGDPAVLKAWGLGQPLKGAASLAVAPKRLRLGDTLAMTVTLQSHAARAQKLVVDYAVHHVKANGTTAPKVFKGWNLELAAKEAKTLARRHAVRPITTRTYHAGRHEVDLRVNGAIVARAYFDLKL